MEPMSKTWQEIEDLTLINGQEVSFGERYGTQDYGRLNEGCGEASTALQWQHTYSHTCHVVSQKPLEYDILFVSENWHNMH